MGDISAQHSPQRRRRKISQYVRELYATLTNILDGQDRTLLIKSLNQYQRDRNVNNLVSTLKSILDTSTKREVYPLLRQVVPHNDQEKFNILWHSHEHPKPRQRSKSPARSPANLHRIPASSSLPDNLHRHVSDSGIDLSNMTQFSSLRDAKHPIKRLSIKRPSNSGFGFYIRGGSEHGVGLYVSSVDTNSVAEAAGMLPGDHIIQVNGTKFDGLTHAQAVKNIQHSKKLNLTVQSVGRIPDSFVAESTCKWVDTRGHRTSPPPGVDSNGRILTADGIHKSDLRLLGDDDERKCVLPIAMLSFREALAEDEFPVCPEGENDLDPSDGWDVDFSLEDAVRPEIRLYAGARPDVTLCCNGGRKLLAHRRILAEVGYFESLFQDLDQVDLTVEEDLETFLEVIRWIYCRSATSDKERALDLLRLAESYEIEGLIDHAARVLAAPFSCPTDGENVLDEERLEKEDHDIVKAFLHEEESPKEGIPPKPHKMKDV